MYYIVNKQSKGKGYTALAKKTPFKDGYFEPERTWFKCAEIKEGALTRLKKSLPDNDWIEWEGERRHND